MCMYEADKQSTLVLDVTTIEEAVRVESRSARGAVEVDAEEVLLQIYLPASHSCGTCVVQPSVC